MLPRYPTRPVRVGTLTIGNGQPIVIQSMCATKTSDVATTVRQIEQLTAAGAGVVRLAVDNRREAEALQEIRAQTGANLSVDLQENYRVAAEVAPWVEKIRYNPGHLFHHEPSRSWREKVRFLADVAGANDCALRVGVNCGSIDPEKKDKFPADDPLTPMLESAWEHCELLDRLGFTRYVVSLKDSDPDRVVELNHRFAARRPDVPLHLGVTEAGMPPEGILKTRRAFEPLLREGIGDTLRVSLTVPVTRKHEEVAAGLQIVADVAAGRFLADRPEATATGKRGLEIISCPSCSRVENDRFCELAERVREATRYAAEYPVTIAVMGCRVNGPGETDRADLGLWCGADCVHLKRGSRLLGVYSFEQIISRLRRELDAVIREFVESEKNVR
ncbi:MAG: flavodoxin-dependent (E)-4-hydroxy-3-methylbut-2-enyl-diphosphate synthase [Pirellulales bacterium]|nr:flavodoxin-dependent (E)-4-hydroxy-3-methylbut-2-enyl-diphosphate synthase [Pirellulales bacterium]